MVGNQRFEQRDLVLPARRLLPCAVHFSPNAATLPEPTDSTPPFSPRGRSAASRRRSVAGLSRPARRRGGRARGGGPRRRRRGGRSRRPHGRACLPRPQRGAVSGGRRQHGLRPRPVGRRTRRRGRRCGRWSCRAQPACLAAMRRLPPSRSSARASSRRSGSRTSRGSRRRRGLRDGSGSGLFMDWPFGVREQGAESGKRGAASIPLALRERAGTDAQRWSMRACLLPLALWERVGVRACCSLLAAQSSQLPGHYILFTFLDNCCL